MDFAKIKFDREEDFENAFIELLKNCGWEKDIISYPTEEDLINNWANILYNNNRSQDKLGDYPLTRGEMGKILEKIRELKTPYALNGFINGKVVTITRDNKDDKLHYGKEVSLHIYDRMEIAGGKSRYQIVKQPKFNAPNNLFPNRRGDIMLLINGMPVFHIELKKSGVPISQALNQIEKYSKEYIFSGLFSLVQIFIAMTPDDAVYFANPGCGNQFNSDFYFHWGNVDNIPIKNWYDFTQNLLFIPMAHQLIGFYTVADGKDGMLKVLRSYQYYAVSAITNIVKLNKWDSHKQRGGYIWHTTGSGKTLTSFKTADLIAKSKDADKVVFLFDRIELNVQSLGNYKNFADNEDDITAVSSQDTLVGALTNTTDDLIVASIQRMNNFCRSGSVMRANDLATINKKRLVFIVDECHRDTFGEMMGQVKATFKNALFFGFSGTPIQDENKKKGCTSSDVFGDELHRYTIGDGIRDKNVLPFDTYMVKTFDDNDIKSNIASEMVHATSEDEAIADSIKSRKYYEILNNLQMAGHYNADGEYVKGAEDYIPASQYRTDEHINLVVADILSKFKRVSHNGKFHAIFATSSIPEAIEYYKRLKTKIKATVLVDPSDNNDDKNFDKIQGLAEVINDYNEAYNQNFSIPTYSDMKKDVSLRLSHDKMYRGIEKTPDKQLNLLIVVNQMLTGFDSKWINTLFLDKLMKQENIIQAFSRTNRIFGYDKPSGIIYYYRYPHTMERNIAEAVKMYSGNKEYIVFVDKLERNLEKLNSLYLDIKEIFECENIADFSHLPEDASAKVKFAHCFNKLNSILEMVKVQGFTWKVAVYGSTEVCLTKEIYLVLLQRYKELFTPSAVGSTNEVPFDLNPRIAEISTGKIDADYMNRRFERFLKLKLDGASKADTEVALQALYKSFAMLPEKEQKFAEIFIKDVQLGNVIPKTGETFREYITKYMKVAKDAQIHNMAEIFGLDEALLVDMLQRNVDRSNLDEFGRFGKLKATADVDKIKDYFYRREGEKSLFKARVKFDLLLTRFIIEGGFDIDTPNGC